MFEFPASISFLTITLGIYVIILTIKEFVRIKLMTLAFKNIKKSIKKIMKQIGNNVSISINNIDITDDTNDTNDTIIDSKNDKDVIITK